MERRGFPKPFAMFSKKACVLFGRFFMDLCSARRKSKKRNCRGSSLCTKEEKTHKATITARYGMELASKEIQTKTMFQNTKTKAKLKKRTKKICKITVDVPLKSTHIRFESSAPN